MKLRGHVGGDEGYSSANEANRKKQRLHMVNRTLPM